MIYHFKGQERHLAALFLLYKREVVAILRGARSTTNKRRVSTIESILLDTFAVRGVNPRSVYWSQIRLKCRITEV